jgi:integrase
MITIQFRLKDYKNKPSLVYYRVDGDVRFKAKTHWAVRKEDWLDGDINPKAGAEYDFIRSKIREARNFVEIEINSKYFNLTSDQLRLMIDGKINDSPKSIHYETVSSLVLKYKDRCEKIGYSINRVRFYGEVATAVKKFNDPALETLNKKTMLYFMEGFMTYLIAQGYDNTYTSHFLTAISTTMQFYQTDLHVPKNAVFNARRFSRKSNEPIYFTTEEIMLLNDFKCGISQRQVIDLLVFSAFTGLRHGELYYVSPDSIKQREDIWVLERYSPKENNSNVVPLNDLCMKIINRYRHIDHNVVLRGQKMNCILPVITNIYCNRILHAIMEEIAGPFFENYRSVSHYGVTAKEKVLPRWKALSFHAARHHYAFWLRKRGVSISDVSALLNHKSLATTLNIYKHEDAGVIADRTYKLMVGDR